ncbi:MAG: chromate transporter [Firmicutes bacterium]|jgi:chromate transporter|nr:chromate transporter [Bacillota bacterium]NLL87508.1 chromate transporter [Bacillota bacterium]
MNWKLYLQLFESWFKVGLFTFGGGYAMLPMIEKEVIDRRSWASDDEIMDIFALSQSLPGAIAINSAIFLGYRLAGVMGAIAAAAGVVLPSLLIILVIAAFFASFMENRLIVSAFTGIRAAVVGLVAAAAVRITGANCRSIGAVVLAFLSLVINLFTGIHAMWVIVSGALVGIVLYYLPRRGNSKIPGDEQQ